MAEDRNIAHQSLRDQWRRSILDPLRKLKATCAEVLVTVVIDALDECENENDVRGVIQLFAEAKALSKGRIRIFLTSRPETPIRVGFREIPEDQHHDFVLHSISSSIVAQDLSIFFRHELSALGSSEQWPSASDIASLVERAGGLFIWAATVCRFIKGGKRLAWKRLESILNGDSVEKGAEKKLDEIYTTILLQSIIGEYNEQDTEEVLKMFRDIIGSIVILIDPLPAPTLARLLDKSTKAVDHTLNDLYSILEVPSNQTDPVRLIHPSFHDFLLSKERCVKAQL